MKLTYNKEFDMFNISFNTLADAMKFNNLTEKEMVEHLQGYFKNQNYRKAYNKGKNEMMKTLKNDPIVLKRIAELKKKVG